MRVQTKWFRCYAGKLNNMSGEPYGFWFMWGPRPWEGERFSIIPHKWMATVWAFGGWRLGRDWGISFD